MPIASYATTEYIGYQRLEMHISYTLYPILPQALLTLGFPNKLIEPVKTDPLI